MKLMVRILEEIEVTRPQQLVLLSMAENARDDGSKCFPSVDLIAWKAGYKPRAVIDIMRELRKQGILEVVAENRARRPTEYHIHIDRAPRKLSFEQWQAEHGRHSEGVRRGAVSREVHSDEGCNLTSPEVQSHVLEVQSHVKNTRENAPEPVREPVKRTSKGTSHSSGAAKRTTPKPKAAPKTLLPDDFGISDRLMKWAEDKGFTVAEMESQLERFQNNARMKQHRYADWDAAFQNWMHNARDWGHLDKVNQPANVTPFKGSHRNDNGYPDGWTGSPRDFARLAEELERQGR